MDRVARLDPAQRRQLFSETAARMNLLPGLVEKDFWVCWTLKQLFSIPAFENRLLFKGGTTLSKIHDVIHRFSEDIDLAVDWEMLGFAGDRSPAADLSKTKRDRLLEEMLAGCRRYVASEFIPLLRKRGTAILPGTRRWHIEVDPDAPDIVDFRFPASADDVAYVRPVVRLELGTHAGLVPNDRYVIRPYAAEHFPSVFEDADCPVQAIKPERTFW